MAEPGYLSVWGHDDLRARLTSAATAERLPQSMLFQGPAGVGKQRLAIWTAAVLNCRSSDPRPCGECKSCRLAARLEHPDIHWFFPLTRPKRANSPEQMRQKLEDQRAEELEARRTNRFYLDEHEGARGIYVGAVHTMRMSALSPPAMGPNKVLVIGRAEALIPQMGSHEAANALLKLLEEPPRDTNIILTSDVPGALLPTIRSRVQVVRVAPLPIDQVREFLVKEPELSPQSAGLLAAASSGSIGKALAGQTEERGELRRGAIELVRGLLDGRPEVRLALAHAHRAFGARGTFDRMLIEATRILRDLLATSSGASEAAFDPETVQLMASKSARDPQRLIRAMEAVEDARQLAERNVNPQLIVANLLAR